MKVRLDEIIEKTFAGEWGSDDVDNNGIPVLRTTNFTNDGTVNYSDVVTRKITKENINHKFLKKGDILIEKSGGSNKQPVGRVVYFVGEENKFLFNNFTGLIRVKNYDKWSSEYIFYSLFVNYLNGSTKKFENKTTGLHNLKLDSYLKSVEITERSLKEQQAIVNVLNHLNKIIQKRKKQLKKLDELVKSRFIEMFGDPLKNTLKWKIKKLKLIAPANEFTGDIESNNEKYWLLQLDMIESNTGKILSKYFVSLDKIGVSTIKFSRDNVLYSKLRPYLNKVVLPDVAGFATSEMIPLFPTEELNKIFLAFVLRDDGIVRFLNAHVSGSKMPRVQADVFWNLGIILPPITLQNQFADFVEQTDKSKLEIQKSLDKLEILKKSLMQKYFG